jgi:hypothetical protein
VGSASLTKDERRAVEFAERELHEARRMFEAYAKPKLDATKYKIRLMEAERMVK